MQFSLFILVTAIMIIRPTDFIPGLERVNLYLIAIVPCILLSWHKVIPQLTTAGLRERPVLVFGIGILLVSLISNFAHGQFQVGFNFATDFLKILIFYLLMLAHIDSPARLRLFLGYLVSIILVPILLAVLDYHGYYQIPQFNSVVTEVGRRLGATGVFGDPNDVCEILNCAMFFSLFRLLDRGGGLTRFVWVAPMALFSHALALTQSRGGFLGAAVGLMVLFRSRYRGKKSLVLAGMVLALMFVLFRGGRQTSFSTSEGTSQSRIQVWDAGFEMFRRSPLFGIGVDRFVENVGHVAHNAFVQTYTELGFVGGTLLFGQYFYCLKSLAKLGSARVTLPDPEMHRVRPFLLASLAGFATSEMSLTNPFSLMAYTMFGLATVFIRLAGPSLPLPDLFLSGRLVRRMFIFSGLFLVALYIFTRLSVRYG